MTQQNENAAQPGEQRTPTPYMRLRGLVLLLIGLGFAKWQIYDPLHARENGLTEVTTSSAMMALAIILPVCGLAIMLAGNGVERFFETVRANPKQLSAKSIVFLSVMAAIGLAAMIWVEMALEAQGFRHAP